MMRIVSRLRHSLAIGLAASSLWNTPAQAAETPGIEQFYLANGLEVIVIPNHRVPAVSHMVWYKIGAADDPVGKSGLAHFHEHIMFKGAAKYKAGEYARIIAAHGGQQNAFTGRDATSYYVDISKEELPLAMELEADRMRGLTPTDQDIVSERQVILEERRMRIENEPGALLSEQMDAALFRHHPYHIPVIGWMHEMEGLTKEDILAFHKRYYHPNNAILIVSGDITAKELRPLAERYYGGLAKKEVPARRWNSEPPQIAPRRVTLHHPNVKQPEWVRSYEAASLSYGDKSHALPLFVLAQSLGGKTGKLYKRIVLEQKLASSIDADYNGFSVGPATFDISAVPEQGVELATLEKAIDDELAKAATQTLSTGELARAKTLLKAETIYARDGLASMARIMGWLRIAGKDSDYFSVWPDLIEQVTTQQMHAAASATLKSERSVTGWLLPKEEKTP